MKPKPGKEPDAPPTGAAFLLAQIGSHAAMKFAERLAEHDLTPPQAGILRLIRTSPGLSQQALAERLGILPSRVVGFVDDLEDRGLVRRDRDPADRRANVLVLTAAGGRALRTLGTVARAHESEICAALTERERRQLTALLGRVAAEQGLTPGVHPGYRALAGSDASRRGRPAARA
jgi:DNA-binding MarR family transcriptional regulator